MKAARAASMGVNGRSEMANLLLFLTGKLVSIFGTSIYTFAMGLYVLKMTGSGLSFAATLVLGIIPLIVINPFAGVMADRFDKKAMVITMDLLSGILLMAVYFLTSAYGLDIPVIYGTTFILTVLTTFFGVTAEAAKPNIVSGDKLMDINSISQIIDSFSSILGPMLGGIIFAIVDARLFILVNGVSFLFSAVCETFINFRFNGNNPAEKVRKKVSFFQDIRDGFKYLVHRKDIRGLMIILIALNFFLGFSVIVPLPFIINNVLKLASGQYGMIEGAFSVGLIIGALMVKRAHKKVPYIKLLKGLGFLLALGMIIEGIPIFLANIDLSRMGYLIYYCALSVVLGISISLIDIPIAYIVQKTVPDEYRGRVMSIGISIGKTMLPVAVILSGSLINILPAYFLPMAGGVLFLVFNLGTLRKEFLLSPTK